MRNPLVFPLSRLQAQGRIRVSEAVAQGAFEEALRGSASLRSPVSVELSAEWRERRVWLAGTASGDWELACCRCLRPSGRHYAAKLDGTLEEPGEFVDAEEEVRQALLLAVPLQPLCRPDCKGLCAQCGQDKNVADCGCVPPSRFKVTRRGKPDA